MTGLDWTRIDEPLFERIVDAILDRIHGDRGFAPEGRGGDQGIDYTVDDNKIIYQYKFYPGGENTASRKRQIKRSFSEAMKHRPEEWIAVIPAKLLPAMRTYILGLGTETKISIRDRAWLDNRLSDFPDLAEYFRYRTDSDYLFAKAEALKVNPLFRNSADVDDKIATLQRAIDASDRDWTFDITTASGRIVKKLRAKHPNAQQRSPIEITFTTAIPDDSPQRRQIELNWGFGVVEPIEISGSMVRDLKITGPDLVTFEGPVDGLELLPDPDSASPWADTDIKVTDADSKPLGTHLARSRLVARGGKGLTIEVQVGALLRMLFRSPDDENEDGRVDFTTEEFGGRPVNEALAVTDFLTQLRQGATVDFVVDGSPLMKILLTGVVEADWPEHFKEVRALAEDLVIVERETNSRFRYPRDLTGFDRINIRNARLLLEGHVVVHPTHNQMNAKIDGVPDASLDTLLTGQHGWMIWKMSPGHLVVLEETIEVPELAVGGPTRLSDENIAAVRKAIATGTSDGAPLAFKLEPDDRLRMWLPDRFKGEVLAITPWDLPGVEIPEGCRAGVVGTDGLTVAPTPPNQ